MPHFLDLTNPAFDLVTCPTCDGKGQHVHEEWFGRRHDQVVRTCRSCSGSGQVLRGDPPDTGNALTIDYRQEATHGP